MIKLFSKIEILKCKKKYLLKRTKRLAKKQTLLFFN